MARNIYGIGINLGKGTKGFLSTVMDKRIVLDDLTALILTNPGERINNPDFGVGLEQFLFEPNDDILSDVIKKTIITQVNLYLPIVNIITITFTQIENIVKIKLLFTIKDVTAAGEVLTLERDIQRA